MAVTMVRIEIDSPDFDGNARRVVRSLRDIEDAADEMKRSTDQAENSLRRLTQAIVAANLMRSEALAESVDPRLMKVAATARNPVSGMSFGLSSFGPMNGVFRPGQDPPGVQRAAAALPLLASPGARILVEAAAQAFFAWLIDEITSSDCPGLAESKSSALQLDKQKSDLERLQGLSAQLERRRKNLEQDNLPPRFRPVFEAEIADLEDQIMAIREEALHGPVVQPLQLEDMIGSFLRIAEDIERRREIQEEELRTLKSILESMGQLPEVLQETNRFVQERMLGPSNISATEQAHTPIQEISGETTRLLQDVLTELTRLLQEIDGPALLKQRCEGVMPLPGLPRPGLPGNAGPAGGALCPTEELERQRDGLLLESGETANGLQAGLLAYAESALDVNEQVKAATLSAFQGMEDALVSFVQTGKLNFKGLVDAIIADLIRIAVRAAILGPIGHLLGNAFDSGSAFLDIAATRTSKPGGIGGFAQGGAFTVGGNGGTDSQLVRFRATPGERVTVTRPDRAPTASPVNLNVNIHNEVPEARVSAQTMDGDNGTALRIQIARVIDEDIRSGGQTFRSIRDTFGANPLRREVS